MRETKLRLIVCTVLMAGLSGSLMAQWTQPTLYAKGESDHWQTSNPDYSGYNYNLNLDYQVGGTITKFWTPTYQFQQTYHTSGWYESYWEYQWTGSTYQHKAYQYDSWHCCDADLPWGDIQRLQSGQQQSGSTTWSRTKDVWLEVATGGSERDSKYLLLSVSGFAYTGWANGVNGPAPTGTGYQLAWNQFTVMGGALNPDFSRFRKVTANSTVDATPSSSASSYSFGVTIVSHKLQTLTVSRHPNANNRDWQTAFDIGSDALGKDDDGDGNTGSLEDEGCYVEFLIKPASNPLFPVYYQTNACNNIQNPDWFNAIVAANFANIKTVTSIDVVYPDQSELIVNGYAPPSGASMVLTSDAAALLTVHEYGHLCGLNHRGDTNGNNAAGDDQYHALMTYNEVGSNNNEVNGFEIPYFENSSVSVLGL